jgi:hypothetical protein
MPPISWDSVFGLMAALGLSLSAGVRAYLPFVALGIASHIDMLHLNLLPQFEWIGHPLAITIFILLTIYEIGADKIPVIDHLNDLVHTIIRPLSGAILFVATDNALSDIGTTGMVIAGLIGAGLAGTTHAVKAGVVRPASTATTAGLANPIVSLVEDILSFFLVILSVLLPILAVAIFVIGGFVVIRTIRNRSQRKEEERLRKVMAASPPRW